MTDVLDPCFNCARGWHHQCEKKNCIACHGASALDATPGHSQPPAASEVQRVIDVAVEEPVEPQVDPHLKHFAQQLLISLKVNAMLSGEHAPPAIPVNCPEHGWATTPIVTCNRCLQMFPVLAFLQGPQSPPNGGVQTEVERVQFCDCGLQHYRARCPVCENQIDQSPQGESHG